MDNFIESIELYDMCQTVGMPSFYFTPGMKADDVYIFDRVPGFSIGDGGNGYRLSDVLRYLIDKVDDEDLY